MHAKRNSCRKLCPKDQSILPRDIRTTACDERFQKVCRTFFRRFQGLFQVERSSVNFKLPRSHESSTDVIWYPYTSCSDILFHVHFDNDRLSCDITTYLHPVIFVSKIMSPINTVSDGILHAVQCFSTGVASEPAPRVAFHEEFGKIDKERFRFRTAIRTTKDTDRYVRLLLCNTCLSRVTVVFYLRQIFEEVKSPYSHLW